METARTLVLQQPLDAGEDDRGAERQAWLGRGGGRQRLGDDLGNDPSGLLLQVFQLLLGALVLLAGERGKASRQSSNRNAVRR